MFLETDIIEFINRIINSCKSNNGDIKRNIIKFRDYLVLTKMTDNVTIDKVDKIIECLDSIITIKNTIGSIDVSAIFNEPVTEEGKKLRKVPITQPMYKEKHYHHYHNDTVDSCGCSSVSRSRC